jgi:hypothetical protein
MGDRRNSYKTFLRNLKQRNHMEDIRADGRILFRK